MLNNQQHNNYETENIDSPAINIAKNLSLLMEQKNVSAVKLSKATNISPSTISRLLSGFLDDPKASMLTAISKYFGVSVDQLLGLSPIDKTNNLIEYVSIPILSWKECLIISKNGEDQRDDWIQVKMPVANNAYGLRSKPHHSPRFPYGSVLIVDPTLEVCEGDLVIVYKEGSSEATIRQVLQYGKTIIFSNINEDINEEDSEYKILGVISETIFTYKYRENK
jgi:transcriptional regulator with XRE-family HTH domain